MCGHSYCRYTVFKEAPAYQMLHSSINDKKCSSSKTRQKSCNTGIVASHGNKSFSKLN